jgi:hypothetical protein
MSASIAESTLGRPSGLVTACMAQHVRVSLEAQLGGLAGSLDELWQSRAPRTVNCVETQTRSRNAAIRFEACAAPAFRGLVEDVWLSCPDTELFYRVGGTALLAAAVNRLFFQDLRTVALDSTHPT